VDTTIFIQNLKFIFANYGITKAHVAKQCSVSKATVSMWLSGRKPYSQSIETMADIFSALLFVHVSSDLLVSEDLQVYLRRNEVKQVVMRSLFRELSALPIEKLIQANEIVHRLRDDA
jgi:transcriptional regulator with XRE-family HTH domain